MVLDKFAAGTSEVDWCEANYEITHFIAEFYNTVSNVLFFVFPPLLIYLYRQYSNQVSWGINVVWILLFLVGAGSVYFHATLSLVGQLVDEIAIIWVFLAAIALWWPKRLLPIMFQNRNIFQSALMIFGAISSGLACVIPAINCVALFLFAIPSVWLLVDELRRCECERAFSLGIRTLVTFVFAITSWVSDKLFCSVWERIGFPYLHSFWHIFVLLSSYQTIVLISYFDAKHIVPEQMPVLNYWPKNTWDFFGIPYVCLKCVGVKPQDRKLI